MLHSSTLFNPTKHLAFGLVSQVFGGRHASLIPPTTKGLKWLPLKGLHIEGLKWSTHHFRSCDFNHSRPQHLHARWRRKTIPDLKLVIPLRLKEFDFRPLEVLTRALQDSRHFKRRHAGCSCHKGGKTHRRILRAAVCQI